MSRLCETACGRASKTSIPITEGEPERYRLCEECARRLTNRSLRPLERYNLAVIHSPCSRHLTPNYGIDGGPLDEPFQESEDAHLFPAPTLEEVRHDLNLLLDFCQATTWLRPEHTRAFSSFTIDQVMHEIDRRLSVRSDDKFLYTFADVLASRPNERVRDWFRDRLSRRPASARITLLELTRDVLPPSERFDLGVRAETEDSPSRRIWWFKFLVKTGDMRCLDWLEAKLPTPTPSEWGFALSIAGPDWAFLRAWLQRGNAFGLAAIDTLAAYFMKYPPANKAPEFDHPRTRSEVKEAVLSYAASRPTPRVEHRVKDILAGLDRD